MLPRPHGLSENTLICGAESPNRPRLPKLEVASSNLVRRFASRGRIWLYGRGFAGLAGGPARGQARAFAGKRDTSAGTGSEDAAKLAIDREWRSLDALHLAAALMLPRDDLLLATWDRRLHMTAGVEGLALIPERLD